MKKYKVLVIAMLVLAITVIAGCGSDPKPLTGNVVVVVPESIESYNLDEVAKHNTETDCWTAISGTVYDITPFIALGEHGPAIVNGCGIDATEMFAKHSDGSRSKLGEYHIGGLI